MMALAVLVCGILIALTLGALRTLAFYTARRAALADPPGVWFGPGSSRWFGILLIGAWFGFMACLTACVCVWCVFGRLAP